MEQKRRKKRRQIKRRRRRSRPVGQGQGVAPPTGRGVPPPADTGVAPPNDGEEDHALGLSRITASCEKGFKRVLIIWMFWSSSKIWDNNNMYIFGNTPFFYNLICKRYEAFVVTSRYVGICFVDN